MTTEGVDVEIPEKRFSWESASYQKLRGGERRNQNLR